MIKGKVQFVEGHKIKIDKDPRTFTVSQGFTLTILGAKIDTQKLAEVCNGDTVELLGVKADPSFGDEVHTVRVTARK